MVGLLLMSLRCFWAWPMHPVCPENELLYCCSAGCLSYTLTKARHMQFLARSRDSGCTGNNCGLFSDTTRIVDGSSVAAEYAESGRTFSLSATDLSFAVEFLPRDAMRKRDVCRRSVSICPSVRLSRWWIISTRLKISSKSCSAR